METGLPRNTPIERFIDNAFRLGILTVWYLHSMYTHVDTFFVGLFKKLTYSKLKNKVTYHYYHLLNKIKDNNGNQKG